LCDVGNYLASLLLDKKKRAINQLIENVCEQKRHEVSDWDYNVKFSQLEWQDSLSDVSQGDLVYCTTEYSDVIFLEKEESVNELVRFKTLDGEEKKQYSAYFRKISKGNKYAESIVEGENSEARALLIETKARRCGFRVEKTKKKNSFVLRIFGDKQKQVDDFIAHFCKKDFL
jgi:hypothetical protein